MNRIFLALLFSFLPIFSILFAQTPPLPNNMPNLVRQLKGPQFSVINNAYTITDSYADLSDIDTLLTSNFQIFNSGDSLSQESTLHDHVGDAFNILGVKNYTRHFKTNAFKRFPACSIDGQFYNYNLFNSNQCDELANSTNQAWIDRILTDGQDLGLTVGLYNQALSDFFFQMFYSTGNPASEPNIFSPCICRNPQVNNWDANLYISDINPNLFANGIPAPNLWNNGNYEFEPIGLPEAFSKTSYYLCVNCPAWRTTLVSRMARMATAGADHVYFDVNHMPEEGCFCTNCRSKFANDYCAGNPLCRLNFNENEPATTDSLSYLHGYNHENDSFFTNSRRRLMADLMHSSLLAHFRVIQDTLHSANPNKATLAKVTTAEFPSLINDSHRCAFVNSVDMPKGEWTMPLKGANNRTFWAKGNQSLVTLSNYRIPEMIRLTGAMGLFRDVSKYRLPNLWMANDWRPSNTGATLAEDNAILLENNHKLKTYLGLGYVCGVENSTSFGNFFDYNNDSSSVYFNNTRKDLLSFTPILSFVNNGITSIDTLEGATPIFELDSKFSALLAFKRPYRWATVLFNEKFRNDALYADFPNDSNEEAKQLKAVWQQVLMPMYLGYEALANGYYSHPNGYVVPGGLKLPVGFMYEGQEVSNETKVVLLETSCSAQIFPANGWRNVQLPCHDTTYTPYFALVDSLNLTQKKYHSDIHDQIDDLAPPFYLTADTGGYADKVMVNFYTGGRIAYPYSDSIGQEIDFLTIPFVVNPMWSIPRERGWYKYEFNSNADTLNAQDDSININGINIYRVVGVPITYFPDNNTTDSIRIQKYSFGVGNILRDSIQVFCRDTIIRTTLTTNYATDNLTATKTIHCAKFIDFDPLYKSAYTNIGQVPGNKMTVHINKNISFPSSDYQLMSFASFYYSDPHLSEVNLPLIDAGSEFLVQIPAFAHTGILDIKFRRVCKDGTCIE